MKTISTPQAYLPVQRCLLLFAVVFLCSTGKPSVAFAKLSSYSTPFGSELRLAGNLPAILTPLKGYYSNGVSHLYWKSLQESNGSHYEIERSNDGISFVSVGRVMAKGVSDKEVDYSFDDIKSNAGLNYYRLKQVDRDGAFKNSNIEVLNVTIKGIHITGIYPAPFADKVNVTVSSEEKAAAGVILYDITGKLIVSRQAVLNKGVTTLAIDDLDHLAMGLYIIKVQVGEITVVKKIIK